MFIRICLSICLALALSSCTWHRHTTETLPVLPNGLPQTQSPPSFSRVNVTGNLNLNLHTGSNQPQLVFRGDPRDLSALTWTVKHNELYINLGKGYPKHGPLQIDIYARYLGSLTYKGNGTILGTDLYSRSLDLYLRNKGKTMLSGQIALHQVVISSSGYTQIQGVNSRFLQLNLAGRTHLQLAGVTNLTRVEMKGHSWLSLYWVKSCTLTVKLKEQAQMQLAGIVSTLHVKVSGEARFNGRYLRAREAFVKTYNQSEADISTTGIQHTIAHDASNIYYYELPDIKTDFMAEAGSVLDMREWERAAIRNTTRYNQTL